MAEKETKHKPPMSLGNLLKADLLARYPEAGGWSRARMALRFLSDPSLQAVLTIRLQLASRGRLIFLWRPWIMAKYRMDIFRCEVGPGLHLPHPCGVILARGTKLGSNVTLYQNANLGFARAPRPGHILPSPSVGDRVVIGPSTMIAGPIHIGADSRIGARAVVNRDLPPGSVVEAE